MQTGTESRARMRTRGTVTWFVVLTRELVLVWPSGTTVSSITADSLADDLPLAVLDCW